MSDGSESSVQSCVRAIEQGFAGTSAPPRSWLWAWPEPQGESLAQVQLFTAYERWESIPTDVLNAASGALFFARPIAFRFLCPAYLRAMVRSQLHVADPARSLSLGFRGTPQDFDLLGRPFGAVTWRDYATFRNAHFCLPELEAICVCLDWVTRTAELSDDELNVALREYWHPRLAALSR